jgi:predicted TIM-barrel fold metal-dependent hydrolase
MSLTRVISCDDHMDMHAFPPTLFEERLPAQIKDRAPRVVDSPEGKIWMAEGERWGLSGRAINARMPNIFDRAGLPDNGGFRPSTPELRLEDMDRDGVYAQVIYGPPGGIKLKDKALQTACLQAYNDWGAEFNSVDPNRLCVLPILPSVDAETAAAELRRAARLGHRGALFSIFESDKPAFDEYWNPFWAAANETGLPISFHLIGGAYSLRSNPGSWEMPAFVSIVPMQLDEAMSGMIFSGMLERFPNVKLVLGESGIGWVPYLVERMDHEYHKYYDTVRDYRLKRPPSEIFHDQVFVTYEDDPLGVRLIPQLGPENVMWASDYPHPDSTFPHSRRVIEEQFAGMDESVKQKVCCDNAARLYHIE